MQLTLGEQRVDDGARVVDRDELRDAHVRPVSVSTVDDREVGTERERHRSHEHRRLAERAALRGLRGCARQSIVRAGVPITWKHPRSRSKTVSSTRDLEAVGGDRARRLDQRVTRLMDRGARELYRAGRVGAEAGGDPIGVAVDDLDRLHRQAEQRRPTIIANVVSWPCPCACAPVATVTSGASLAVDGRRSVTVPNSIAGPAAVDST